VCVLAGSGVVGQPLARQQQLCGHVSPSNKSGAHQQQRKGVQHTQQQVHVEGGAPCGVHGVHVLRTEQGPLQQRHTVRQPVGVHGLQLCDRLAEQADGVRLLLHLTLQVVRQRVHVFDVCVYDGEEVLELVVAALHRQVEATQPVSGPLPRAPHTHVRTRHQLVGAYLSVRVPVQGWENSATPTAAALHPHRPHRLAHLLVHIKWRVRYRGTAQRAACTRGRGGISRWLLKGLLDMANEAGGTERVVASCLNWVSKRA